MKNRQNDWESKCLEFIKKGWSNRKIARELFGKSSAESKIRRFLKSNTLNNKEVSGGTKKELKVLFWDIETSIKRSWHFRQDGYLGSSLIDKDFFILSHAWNWLGSDDVDCVIIKPEDAKSEDDYDIVLKAWALLDNADVVIGHNIDKFDIKMINARFLKWGLPPPSPYKTIDTLKLAKRKFGITFKSLKYLCEYLKLPVQKLSHDGTSLWIDATLGDPIALGRMGVYNKGDIPTLKMVYDILKVWGTGTTNIGSMRARLEGINTLLCPSCGSDDIKPLNVNYHTQSNEYTAYRCNACNGVSRLNSIKQGGNSYLISV